MNVLRGQAFALLRRPFCRCNSSLLAPYIPRAQLDDIDSSPRTFSRRKPGPRARRGEQDKFSDDNEEDDEIVKVKPESPSFYTGRATYHDNIIQLQNAISRTRGTLKTLQLLPLPEFARASLAPMRPVWKSPQEMTSDFDTTMTTSRYRRITALLNELNEYLRIATTAGYPDLANMISSIVSMFESGKKDAYLARGVRKTVFLDQYGRSYTFGRRKTSTARVWMIPVKEVQDSPVEEEANDASTDAASSNRDRLHDDNVDQIFGLEPSRPAINVTVSTILINNLPIAEYFPQPAERERIVRPLKVAGVLGKYNIFTIVRGGGTTGQSGAIAHGIAKGIFAHEPETGTVLKRAKLLRRDPRMVERKKTGLAKARKRYTWVKR